MSLSRSHALSFAGLGFASGVCSALVGIERPLDGLQPVADVFALHASLLPVGAIFACALGAASWIALRRPAPAVAVALATLYGWSGAIHTAIRLQRNAGDVAHLLAAGLAAGAIGAAVVAAAFAAFAPSLRRWRAWGAVCLAGAAAGLLFTVSERGYIDRGALFIVWQAVVAAAIGLQLDRDEARA